LIAVHAALKGKPVTALRMGVKAIVSAERLPVWARGIDPKLIARVLGDFVESDERMCKRIGVDHDAGAAAMAMLWGRTFTAERDRQAGSDAKPQHRGQVARQLQMKLQETINRGDDK
jgi:hypothetical protein